MTCVTGAEEGGGTRSARDSIPISEACRPWWPVTAQGMHAWVQYPPDGAVSIDVEDSTLVPYASQQLQERFAILLEKRKAGTLSPEEQRDYAAIGDLDAAMSWLNRLICGVRPR